MTTLGLLILLALGTATGITLVIAALVPGRPRLADVLEDREQATTPPPRHPAFARLTRLLEHTNIAAPEDDLDLVGQSRESFLLQRAGLALGGALWVPLLSVILSVGGVAPPAFLTVLAALAAALAGWLLPPSLLRHKVRRARTAFGGALASYCDLVALGRLGDRGPVEALRYPATLGSGWAFRRIRQALDEAVLRGDMPWDGLQRLAASMGVSQLKDLGQILTSAGQGGASIVDTLRAKAAAIRQQQLADRKATSSIRSDRMDIPIALMGIAFIVFLAFPGMYHLLAG
ncbi:type II secretion system F family protein [Amycolatopsis aidingensis]|uniref:type II secretion system F family protein n=1 Tax=Amycolatopsis aidingensis TaxID=2842453 RepID=UPI001C0D7344|nr:type II secretion system F family protein [Amycolatopsis aidingensis]